MEFKPTKLNALVNMENPQDVFDEVRKTISLIFPQFDFTYMVLAFRDVLCLFQGLYPGYRACDTDYHDLKHTADTVLAMARIIHGAQITDQHFSERDVGLGLISALLHDSGYILTRDEEGPGAKYTLAHIGRSISFMEKYLLAMDFSREDCCFCGAILNCTGLDVKINEIQFASQENETLGKLLGTADLLGQMADRTYLEKLPFLYEEFKTANIKGVDNQLEFYKNTPGFFDLTMDRFRHDLGGVNRYMRHHFRTRWRIDQDLYMSAIENNMEYLKHILEHHPNNLREHLRRTGLIQNIEDIMGTR